MITAFVVGLPRSRMAWVANYLSYGNQLAIFDAFSYGLEDKGPDCIKDFENLAESVVICDLSALVFRDRMISEYPNAKWVIIDRPVTEVVASLKKLQVPVDDKLFIVHHKIGELKLKTSPLVVHFRFLDSAIKDVAKFINPGWTCPDVRHKMLTGLNVQSKSTVKDFQAIPEVNPNSKAAEPCVPTEAETAYFKVLQEICGGNELAYRWLNQAMQCATIIDHVSDGDLINSQQFDAITKGVLLEWGLNSFFMKFAPNLIPVMSASLSAWQHATGDMRRVKHYDIYTEVPCAVAFVLGGQERVDRFSPRLRSLVEQLMQEDDKRDGPS